MREILAALRKALDGKMSCVWCSLIETRGSTPQKAGAAMLVYPDGSQAGTLGGGCVEAEVKQQALRKLSNSSEHNSGILTFNLDDNYGWDDGLICGGRMTILADPLTITSNTKRLENAGTYYGLLQDTIESGTGCTEAVVMKSDDANVQIGSRFLLNQEGKMIARIAASPPADTVFSGLKPVTKRPKPYVANGVAYLPQWPRITVLIVGGGHVGLAVAKLAADVDFDICVVDDRDMYVSEQRFPMAKRRIAGDIGQSLSELVKTQIDASTFCLIVTRGHNHDEEALYHLAQSDAGYVGMIGSKRKIKLIYEDLISRGIPKEALDRVHAPLGFDIGSQTVPEIAVSIVAELIACRNLGATITAARTKVEI